MWPTREMPDDSAGMSEVEAEIKAVAFEPRYPRVLRGMSNFLVRGDG